MTADKKLLFTRFRGDVSAEADRIIKEYGEDAGLSDSIDLLRMAVDYRAAYERSPGTGEGFEAWRNSRAYLEASEEMAYSYLRRSAEEQDERSSELLHGHPEYRDTILETKRKFADLADEAERFLAKAKLQTEKELRILLGIEKETVQ